MDVIEREASLLTERLVEATEKDGSVYPISFLQLNALNVVCSVSVGKSYKTVEDPEFKEIAHMIEVNMLLAGADKDLPSFLPILSPIGFLVEAKTEMKDHIVKIRDPLLKRLISEANVRDGPNIFKRFNEENFPLDDESKLVILSKSRFFLGCILALYIYGEEWF
jgi:hypothetical protein